jgi:hypothetical protein
VTIVTPRNLVEVYESFRGNSFLHHLWEGLMETANISRILCISITLDGATILIRYWFRLISPVPYFHHHIIS